MSVGLGLFAGQVSSRAKAVSKLAIQEEESILGTHDIPHKDKPYKSAL